MKFQVSSTKQKRRIILGALLVAVIAVGWLLLRSSNEPRYEGKTVSYWFKQYCLVDRQGKRPEPNAPNPIEALRAMGTNAYPYLLKEAFSTRQDTTLRTNLHEFFTQFPRSWNLPRFVGHDKMRSWAAAAINDLAPEAGAILPLLESRLRETNTAQYRQAISILAGITKGGEILVPYFAGALHDTNQETQWEALSALQRIGTIAASAVPDLLDVFQKLSQTNELKLEITWFLGHLGSNASPGVPLLKDWFEKETNSLRNRIILATSLFRIDEHQNEAFSLLTNTLKADTYPGHVRHAAIRLEQIGEKARPAIPALLEAMNRTNGSAWVKVMGCLQSFDVPQEQYLPAVRRKLKLDDDESRYAAARTILKGEPSDAESRQVLIDEIKAGSNYVTEAIIALAETGTNASPAVPAVLEWLGRETDIEWYRVAPALKQLGVNENAYLPILKEKLKSHDEITQIAFATMILELAPSDKETQSILVALIKEKSPYARAAMTAIALSGSEAKDALPVLREILKSKDAEVRKTAEEVIKKIEAKPAKKD